MFMKNNDLWAESHDLYENKEGYSTKKLDRMAPAWISNGRGKAR